MSPIDERAALRAAMVRYREASAEYREAKTGRDKEIIAALQRGVPQVMVCVDTGLTREQVRRIGLRREGS